MVFHFRTLTISGSGPKSNSLRADIFSEWRSSMPVVDHQLVDIVENVRRIRSIAAFTSSLREAQQEDARRGV